MAFPVLPAEPAATSVPWAEAGPSEPVAGAGRSSSLKIVFQGDVAIARLDQEDRDRLGGREYAFPRERKEPLEDAKHVRNAVARFNQVKGVTDAERDEAWARIEAAAKTFGVHLQERSWRELKKPKD
jgi:hypothetical protein